MKRTVHPLLSSCSLTHILVSDFHDDNLQVIWVAALPTQFCNASVEQVEVYVDKPRAHAILAVGDEQEMRK